MEFSWNLSHSHLLILFNVVIFFSFPYEHSLPLPTKSCDVNQVLKESMQDDVKELLQTKPQFQREYLMKVTSTTKHRWFPRPGKKFAKKTSPDREYL